jgi:UDP-N-acetylglucosamine 2-epimerase (non-hydrolysing)
MNSRPPLVVHVTGARPNYVKLAPVHFALEARGAVEQRLVHTGQHYDRALRDDFFDELGLPEPDLDLGIGSGTHAEQTAAALVGLERAFVELRPDLVVVAGDVNSTLAGALAAVKLGIPVCHVESGLRSLDEAMPEEHNRRLTDHLSRLLLVHSTSAAENLRREGIPDDRVEFVGNTMIDTLVAHRDQALARAAWTDFELVAREYVLVTLHRPSLVDVEELLVATFEALEELATQVPVLFPAHPRTTARLSAAGWSPCRVRLTGPLGYLDFLSLETRALAVLTDSGGVQEETTALGVPCFTLRDSTERPVTVELGTNTLLGLAPERLHEVVPLARRVTEHRLPPLWDGHAGERAAAAIERLLVEVGPVPSSV